MIALVALLIAAAPALPPCQTEDSANCHWNAATRGDGMGSSFVNVAGVVIGGNGIAVYLD